MATTGVTIARATRWRDWRSWPETFSGLWTSSLPFRTLLTTLVLTSFAILVTFVAMALAIQNNLWESRKDDVLADAQRAVAVAQATLSSAEARGDRTALQALMSDVRTQLTSVSSSDMIAVFRIDDAPSPVAPTGFFIGRLSEDLLSPQLRQRVADHSETQYWQPMAIAGTDGTTHAGIVVGQQLNFPDAGPYEAYIAYDLSDTEQTLVLVQNSLWLAGVLLIGIIASIAWVALRSVVVPITEAAESSARFAGGDLEVRLPVRGEDELATLAVSFNAMADSIEAQIKELGELSLVQQRFVSDVSHELRTPLTTIRLAAEMLNDQRADFDPLTARTTELLHTQVQRFDVLLADLLEISRYDAGSLQLETEATSLAHLAEDIIDEMRPLASSNDTELRFIAPGGHTPVDLDPRRVRRVLRNLVGNAIEHGEGNPVVITVDSNSEAVAVGVRDSGLGMAPADAERVFDRFWRADPSRQRTIGGSGLGLSIALGDARLHGGTLMVWSELGVGTNFVLTIPRSADHAWNGTSPVPLEPAETLAEIGAVTEPIALYARYRSATEKTQETGEEHS